MFTPKQLRDFKAYVKVQCSGKWNMFDHAARTATGLSADEYTFVMKNYAALQQASTAGM